MEAETAGQQISENTSDLQAELLDEIAALRKALGGAENRIAELLGGKVGLSMCRDGHQIVMYDGREGIDCPVCVFARAAIAAIKEARRALANPGGAA